MVTSIVMFKLKEKTDENIAKIKEKLMEMKGEIAQLKDINVKHNLRSSSKNFDAVMIAKYDSVEDFDEYVINPVHVEVGKFILSLCEQTVSILYED